VPDSRIPQLAADELFPPAGAPRSIPHKTGDPSRSVLFDNGHWFHDQQVEVTYRHKPVHWTGKIPVLAEQQLPKTLTRLRKKQPITLAVSGDSISEGYNASGFSGAPPWMPPYPDLVAAQLRASYGSDVKLVNRAVGGWNVGRGQSDLDALLATNPDLVIIAYGMNDVGGRNPEGYRAAIADMLARIKQHNSDTEVILVATMLGNSQWVHTPREMFRPYRDALESFVGPGVALADLTEMWEQLLAHKREVDLNGNGVNHPSDFGHRVYSQVILALLTEPARQ
jgi:lysophospholipase L1-like esterase